MTARSRFSLRAWRLRPLRGIAAALALVTQLGLVAADVAEGSEGLGSAAHVETRGTSRHYAHNEATCVVCVARSLHAAPQKRHVLALDAAPHSRELPVPAARPVPVAQHSPRLSRAPPSMI